MKVSGQLHAMAVLYPWGWGTPLVTLSDLRPVFTLWGAGIAQSLIASRYGLGGPGSNLGGDEIFRTCPDRL